MIIGIFCFSLRAENITSNSVELQWQPPGEDEYSGSINFYTIERRTTTGQSKR